MKTKNYIPKKDRSFIGAWIALKLNQLALKQIKIIAQAQANLDNCAQYVMTIGKKYCVLSTREIDKNKRELGRPHVLRINELLKEAVFVAYPQKNNLIINQKKKSNDNKKQSTKKQGGTIRPETFRERTRKIIARSKRTV